MSSVVDSLSSGNPLLLRARDERIDNRAPTEIYYGKSIGVGHSESAAVWQIYRKSIVGNVTTIEYAGNGQFDQIWANRYSLFGAVAYSNTRSAVFDGLNDYMLYAPPTSLNIVNNITVGFWVKGAGQTSKCLVSDGNPNNLRWKITSGITGGTNTRFVVTVSSTGGTGAAAAKEYLSSLVVLNGSWNHVAFTFSAAGALLLYVNGVLDGAPTLTQNPAITTIFTGAQNGMTAGAAPGATANAAVLMDELAIWNTVLTAPQLLAVYNAGSAPNLLTHSASANLKLWMRMGDADTLPQVNNVIDGTSGTMLNGAGFSTDAPT